VAEIGALAPAEPPLDPARREPKRVWVVDALITAAAVTATAVAVLRSLDGRINLFDGAIAALTAAAVTSSGWMLRRGARGVFLTPTLRIIALMAFAASLGVLFGGRPAELAPPETVTPPKRPPIDVTRSPEYIARGEEIASLTGQLQAAKEEITRLREALEKEGSERQRLVDEANALLTKRLLDQSRSAPAPVPPNQPPDSADENGVLARAWDIPSSEVVKTRIIVSKSEVGRSMIRDILEGTPVFGPALGGLFGGGKTRATTERVVQRLNGGIIPAAEDLRELLHGSDDPAAVKADLLALVEAGRSRNVISADDADKIRDEIEKIANSLRPIDPILLRARATIAQALAEGRTCSINFTKPDFVAFLTPTQKADLLQATTDGNVRTCLDQYPVLGEAAQ
jgi:hypothetical protein